MSTLGSNQAQDLRQRAEDSLAKLDGDSAELPWMSPFKVARTLHELQVHQIELEMQNQDLRRSQLALEASRASYADLYQQAPVGYISINEQGVIVLANLHAATLLDMAPQELPQQPMSRFVFRDDQDAYFLLCRQALVRGERQAAELRLLPTGGTPFWSQWVTSTARDEAGTPVLRVVLSDITAHRQAQEQRRKLSYSLVKSQEEIRRRYARELHERTSPNLAALRINLDVIAGASPQARSTSAFADRVEDTRALIEDTTQSVREICAELQPPAIELNGLLPAVHNYAQVFARRTGLVVQVDGVPGSAQLDPDQALLIFRIVQEALTNCAKHARASRVQVRLDLQSNPMLIQVSDDGCGFEPKILREQPHLLGLGLLNMQESSEFVGGRFELSSQPGMGTQISIELAL